MARHRIECGATCDDADHHVAHDGDWAGSNALRPQLDPRLGNLSDPTVCTQLSCANRPAYCYRPLSGHLPSAVDVIGSTQCEATIVANDDGFLQSARVNGHGCGNGCVRLVGRGCELALGVLDGKCRRASDRSAELEGHAADAYRS